MSDVNLPVVIGAFVVYTLAIVLIGLWSARFARRSDEDYFLAGRSLNAWVAALSASASSESGWVTLGLVGWAFTEGVKAYWIIPGCLAGFAFNWFFIAGRMSDRARTLNALTLPDFFSFNFRERLPLLRTLSVIVILVAMFLYVSAQFAAAGKAFGVIIDHVAGTAPQAVETAEATATPQTPASPLAVFTNPGRLIPTEWGGYQYGVLMGGLIVLLYTTTGGFRAVCWTDFLQALLMVGTLVVFPIYLFMHEGGWEFIAQHLGTGGGELLEFCPRVGIFAFIGFIFGSGALGINFGYPGQPHVLVRFMALKDRRAAIVGGIVAIVWGALVYWGAVTVGLFARAMAEAGADWATPMVENKEIYGELGLVLASLHMLRPLMSGLVLAAVLAAICSTADSQIVVAASSVANDLYARLVRRARGASHMLVNRLTVVSLGCAGRPVGAEPGSARLCVRAHLRLGGAWRVVWPAGDSGTALETRVIPGLPRRHDGRLRHRPVLAHALLQGNPASHRRTHLQPDDRLHRGPGRKRNRQPPDIPKHRADNRQHTKRTSDKRVTKAPCARPLTWLPSCLVALPPRGLVASWPCGLQHHP